MAKRKKKKRTGLGTGEGCMGLNIKDHKDCPFRAVSYEEGPTCLLSDCDERCGYKTVPSNCKLKEHGRIIIDWSE